MSSQHNKDKNKGFVSQYQAEDLSRLSLEPFTPMLTPITEGNPGWSPDQKKQGNICSLFSLHLALVILTFLWPKKALMKSFIAIAFFTCGRDQTAMHGFINTIFVSILTLSDTDSNLQKAGSGFQSFFLISFKWPSIFYVSEFSTASITIQSTHFPTKSVLFCEVPTGLCSCFCSSPQSAWGILCFKSS